MTWIAPAEKDAATQSLEKRLWEAADQFRANSGLKSQEYSAPVLGLIFLRFAEARFAAQRGKLELPSTLGRGAGGEGIARYRDISGHCKAATLKEIEAQGWSITPGRYVGVAAGEAVSDEDFQEQLETLNAQARQLETTIASDVAEILGT